MVSNLLNLSHMFNVQCTCMWNTKCSVTVIFLIAKWNLGYHSSAPCYPWLHRTVSRHNAYLSKILTARIMMRIIWQPCYSKFLSCTSITPSGHAVRKKLISAAEILHFTMSWKKHLNCFTFYHKLLKFSIRNMQTRPVYSWMFCFHPYTEGCV